MKPPNPVYRIIVVRTVQASLLGLIAHWLLHWPLTGPHALGLFLTPALCLYFLFVFVAPWSWGLPILTRLASREPVIALTFDDGPSPTTLPVLDVLREHDVKATFFVLGEAVTRHPDTLRRIVAEGHSVGIHAYCHRPFTLLGFAEIEGEIQRTREAVMRACPDAAALNWLRPPHGFKSLRLLWGAKQSGVRLVTWSVDGRDYRDYSSEQIVRNVLCKLQPGAIVLLHDCEGNAATVAALSLLLPEIQVRGYHAAILIGAQQVEKKA